MDVFGFATEYNGAEGERNSKKTGFYQDPYYDGSTLTGTTKHW